MFVREVQGGDSATIWRSPKTRGWNSRTPFSSIDPTNHHLSEPPLKSKSQGESRGAEA